MCVSTLEFHVSFWGGSVFSRWKWPAPVMLTEVIDHQYSPHLEVWKAPSAYNRMAQVELMPVLTPAYPSKNSSFNVSTSTQRIMCAEFKRAHELTERMLFLKTPDASATAAAATATANATAASAATASLAKAIEPLSMSPVDGAPVPSPSPEPSATGAAQLNVSDADTNVLAASASTTSSSSSSSAPSSLSPSDAPPVASASSSSAAAVTAAVTAPVPAVLSNTPASEEQWQAIWLELFAPTDFFARFKSFMQINIASSTQEQQDRWFVVFSATKMAYHILLNN